MANEKINLLLEAQDNASKPLKNLRGEIDKVGSSAKKTAQTAKGISGSLGDAGRSAGQAGIQFQQFVGQVQGGVNPLVAFSQQAADLGIVLGAPLLGAITGIAAAIGMTLLPAIFEADEAFADFQKRIKSITQDFKVINEETKAELIRKQREEVEKAGEAFANQQSKVADLEKSLAILQQRLQGGTGEQIVLNREIARFQKNLDEARAKSAELSLVADDQARKLASLKGELGAVATNFTEVGRVIDVTANTVTRGNLALEKEAAIIREQVKPAIQVFFDAKARLLMLQQEGLLTDEEVIARQAQLKEAYEKSTASVDKMKKSVDFANMTMQDVRKTGLQSMEDGLVGLITQTTSVKDAFKSMANSIISDLARLAIRQAITVPLAQSMGLSTSPSFAGGGYTGSGARSGGVDGKGGFPAILHPNETVIDHSAGQSMGGSPVVVNLNISTGVAQTVRTEIMNMLPSITNATKAAIVDAKQRGGSFARAMA
jgi:molybdopterin converting factor small subunit